MINCESTWPGLMLLQIHTVPIATKFNLWQAKFHGIDALANAFS